MKALRPRKSIGSFAYAVTLLLLSNGVRGQQPALPVLPAGDESTGRPAQRFLLDRSTASRFDSAFDDIAERGHTLIVSEGTPLRMILTAEQLQAQFGEPSADSEQPLQYLIAKLAAAYDYDSEQSDEHTFILRKRYTDPADLPCVTYAEVLSSLKAVLQVIDVYSPSAKLGDFSADQKLYDALSPEQKNQAVMRLMLADLNPGQRQIACEALEETVLEFRVSALRSVVSLLSAVNLRGTTFQWVTLPLSDGTPAEALGYKGRFGRFGGVEARPLTAPFKSIGDAYYNWFIILPKDAKGHPIPRPLQFTDVGGRKVQMVDTTETFAEDPTAPSEQDKLMAADGMLWRRTARTLTLREAAERLRSPLATDAPPSHLEHAAQPTATAEGTVADKVVNVFGQRYQGDARHYLKTLCDVYGLQLLAGEHQTYTIAMPRPRPTDSPAEVPAEIRRVTPLPLIRALIGQTEQSKRALEDRKVHDPVFSQEGAGRTTQGLAYRAAYDSENAYYFPSVRRVIALAKPAVPTITSLPVPVNVVGPEALRLIALTALSGNCMNQLRYLQHYVPPECLVHPETLWMKMSQVQKDGMSNLTVLYGTQRANGTFKYQAETHSSRRLQVDPPAAAVPPQP